MVMQQISVQQQQQQRHLSVIATCNNYACLFAKIFKTKTTFAITQTPSQERCSPKLNEFVC